MDRQGVSSARRLASSAGCLVLCLAACGDGSGPGSSPAPPTGVVLGAGSRHACRLLDDGAVRCWGRADAGQLGTGTTPLRSPPVHAATGDVRFVSLAVGGLHTCALTADGEAWCWGANNVGQAGLPESVTQPCGEPIHGWQCVPHPRRVETSLRFDALLAGAGNTCGFTHDDAIYCWGTDAAGQLAGAGAESCDGAACSRTPVPLPDQPTFASLALGSAAHVCGLTRGGEAYCWGSNAGGQLGVGTLGGSFAEPAPVAGGHRFQAIAVGGQHTCALDLDGRPWCWGRDVLPPGAGGESLALAPVAIQESPAFIQLITGTWAACGRTPEGSVHCWGVNANGEMGSTPVGLNTRVATPRVMDRDPRWTTLVGTWATFCGLDEAEDTWCWGHGADGELGTGEANSAAPVRIGGL